MGSTKAFALGKELAFTESSSDVVSHVAGNCTTSSVSTLTVNHTGFRAKSYFFALCNGYDTFCGFGQIDRYFSWGVNNTRTCTVTLYDGYTTMNASGYLAMIVFY